MGRYFAACLIAGLMVQPVLADPATPATPIATCGTVKDCQKEIDGLNAQLAQSQTLILKLRIEVDTLDAQDAQGQAPEACSKKSEVFDPVAERFLCRVTYPADRPDLLAREARNCFDLELP